MAGYYSDLIYPVAEGAKPKTGHLVTRFSRDGEQVKDNPILPMFAASETRRIGVRLHSRRMEIREATDRLKEKLGLKLFQTGESLYGRWDRQDESAFKFEIDLRVTLDCFDHDIAQKIAKRHWHPELEPEDLFFTVFADELEMRLERSLDEFDGSIDQRIARYQNTWRGELERELSERFGVRVELRFEVALATPKGVIVTVGGGSDATLMVNLKDRLDSKTQLTATVSVEPQAGKNAEETLQRFPQTEREQQDLLRGLVGAAAQERVTLYDYWFHQSKAQNEIADYLDKQLEPFGRTVSSVTLSPISKPPLKDEKVSHEYVWKDSFGLLLPINAHGHISITEDGAGLFERAGKPDRQTLFNQWLAEECEKTLAGKSVIKIDTSDAEDIEASIKAGMSKRAADIGMRVEPFVGEPNLPFKKWQSSNFIYVGNGRAHNDAEPTKGAIKFKTSHETIQAEFSIDLEIVFKERAALAPFLRKLEPFSPDQTISQLEDDLAEEIKKEFSDLAKSAATSVMQTVDADKYFSYFAKSEEWDVPIIRLGTPGEDEEEGGDNKITERIRSLARERYPGVEIRDVVFHRVDSCITKLREFIGRFRTIEHKKELIDEFNAAKNRVVKLTIHIAGGSPRKTVDLLAKNVSSVPYETYLGQIRKGIDAVLETALTPNKHTQEELGPRLESLIDNIPNDGIIDADAELLRSELQARLEDEFERHGLITEKITIFVEFGLATKKASEFEAENTIDAIERINAKRKLIGDQLEVKRIALYQADETTPEGRAAKAELKKTVEEMEQEYDELSAQAGDRPNESLARQAASISRRISGQPPHQSALNSGDASDDSNDKLLPPDTPNTDNDGSL